MMEYLAATYAKETGKNPTESYTGMDLNVKVRFTTEFTDWWCENCSCSKEQKALLNDIENLSGSGMGIVQIDTRQYNLDPDWLSHFRQGESNG